MTGYPSAIIRCSSQVYSILQIYPSSYLLFNNLPSDHQKHNILSIVPPPETNLFESLRSHVRARTAALW